MPIHMFNEGIEATVTNGYERTLVKTGETAHDFYNGVFRKHQRN